MLSGCRVIWISIRTRTFAIGPVQQRFNLLFSCGYFIHMIDLAWSVSFKFLGVDDDSEERLLQRWMLLEYLQSELMNCLF